MKFKLRLSRATLQPPGDVVGFVLIIPQQFANLTPPANHRGQHLPLQYPAGDGCAHGRTNLLHRGQHHLIQTLPAQVAAHGELQQQPDCQACPHIPKASPPAKTMAHPTLSKHTSKAHSLFHSQRNVTDGTQNRLWRACGAVLVCHRLGIVGRWKVGKAKRHKKKVASRPPSISFSRQNLSGRKLTNSVCIPPSHHDNSSELNCSRFGVNYLLNAVATFCLFHCYAGEIVF